MDKQRIEKAVREILIAIGENPDREGLLETPKRVANMYEELFSGIKKNPLEDSKVFIETGANELVIVKDIPIYSMCEHHLLPFIGTVHVAYLPKDGKILGLSKVARIVDTIAKRPQLQERLGADAAQAIEEACSAQGVLVVMEAEHLCMTMRGIRKPGSKTVTITTRGVLKDDAKLREEALRLFQY
ncbi:MAG: GTP cyclohydrolase I FolE [Epulopiscium sp.]|nr:GTP cyclohydrolase I FolE [Candidatus Epulonipiscium sp.]